MLELFLWIKIFMFFYLIDECAGDFILLHKSLKVSFCIHWNVLFLTRPHLFIILRRIFVQSMIGTKRLMIYFYNKFENLFECFLMITKEQFLPKNIRK